jgi:hypothetical protein
MGDQQSSAASTIELQVPCSVDTVYLEQLATCMYSGGSMELAAELVLPLLQLGDAIQVCCLHVQET